MVLIELYDQKVINEIQVIQDHNDLNEYNENNDHKVNKGYRVNNDQLESEVEICWLLYMTQLDELDK
jgi:hypothetical protein